MLNYDETQKALDQLLDALPPGIFTNLNCGVALLEDTIFDANGLLILGLYHVEPYGLGRYVTIHHGSMCIAYGHLPPQIFKDKLKEILYHELTHHVEHLAGDRSLEIKDAIDMKKMLADLDSYMDL